MEVSWAWSGLGAFVFAVYIYGLRPWSRWRTRNFPGPKGAWLLGDATRMEDYRAYKEWADEYGPKHPVAVLFASESLLVMSNAEDARRAIQHNAARPTKFSQDLLVPRRPENDPGEMLIWSNGEQWKALRKAWQPMFYSGSLKGYLGLMDKGAKLLVEEIGDYAGSKKYFEIEKMVQAMTMSVIGQAALGVELHTQKKDVAPQTKEEKMRSEELLNATNGYLMPMGHGVLVVLSKLFPFLNPLFSKLAVWFGDSHVKKYVKSRTDFRNIVNSLLEEHEAATEANLTETNGHAGSNQSGSKQSSMSGAKTVPEVRRGVKPGSFLDLLVQGGIRGKGSSFSHSIKAQQIMLVFIAGYETSANCLSFTLYLLSKACNAEKQAKLVEEVDSLGEDFLDAETLENSVPYLSAVIKESLRLYPPAYLLVREPMEQQEFGGLKVPKGQYLAVSPYALHHDKRIWGDTVEDFIPERWLSNDPVQEKHCKQNFFAFGDGPRVCIGQKFALQEIKIAMIRVFQNFTLNLGPHQEKLELRSALTLGVKNGVYVSAEARTKVVA